MLRRIFSILLGLVVGASIVMLVEYFGHTFFDQLVSANPTPEEIEKHLDSTPFKALVMLPIAWFLGTLVGCTVAASIERVKKPMVIYVVATFLLLLTCAYFLMMPNQHPIWLIVFGFIVHPLAAIIIAKIFSLFRAK